MKRVGFIAFIALFTGIISSNLLSMKKKKTINISQIRKLAKEKANKIFWEKINTGSLTPKQKIREALYRIAEAFAKNNNINAQFFYISAERLSKEYDSSNLLILNQAIENKFKKDWKKLYPEDIAHDLHTNLEIIDLYIKPELKRLTQYGAGQEPK